MPRHSKSHSVTITRDSSSSRTRPLNWEQSWSNSCLYQERFFIFRSNYYSRQVQSSEMGMSLNQTAFLFSFSIRSSQRFSLLIVTSTDRCVSGSSKSKSVALDDRRERRFVEIISSMRWYWRNRDRFASVVKIAFVWRCEWMVTFFVKV